MPTYRVQVFRVAAIADVKFNRDDEDAAKHAALERARNGCLNFAPCSHEVFVTKVSEGLPMVRPD
jgi:hypothetical protein